MNDIIRRAVKRPQIPVVEEPAGLLRSDAERPGVATPKMPATEKWMSWDIAIPDTFSKSHLSSTAAEQGAAGRQAADNKTAKYQGLEKTQIFFPVAIDTAGSWGQQSTELVQEIGRHTTVITEDSRETTFLFQRLSIALQTEMRSHSISTFRQD